MPGLPVAGKLLNGGKKEDSNNMRILMCVANQFPGDSRVERAARALAQVGHKVFVLSPYKAESPGEEDVGYATVLRRIPLQTFAKRALRFVRFSIRGIDPLWQRQITKAVPENDIDVVHVHDLPLVNTGLQVARRMGIQVVADLHENYPEAVQFYGKTWRDKIANVLISERRWRRFEKSWLEQVDRVITVIDEMKERIVKVYGVPRQKITVVMNTEDLDSFLSIPIKEDIVRRYEPYFTISYMGNFGRHRGIQTAISAMPKILQQVPNARLVVVGAGGASEVELRKLARDLKLGDAVEFTGRQPFEAVPSYIAASKVCLIPYIKSVQTNASGPRKLFQYMALGKPLVVSSMASLRRIIGETGAGLVYPAEDADALAKSVIRLYDDSSLANRLGQAGLTAARTKYNWRMEGKKLVHLYQSLQR